MGKLIWHEYARHVSITANCYAIWAGFMSIFFRKFFWDFVGGTLRDPGGIQPSPAARVFIILIVKVPVVQIASMVLGFVILALEYPLPPVKKLSIHRSFALRIVLLFQQSFLTILHYQGTDASLFCLIAAGCYIQAQLKGEAMEEAKENRGTVNIYGSYGS
ncbi:hypothetical protein C8J56DRAFT_1002004 [Mycena floridula]|nr:hypothetical protein C8J56DRAFT_1002004 [Mycena floridula]